jgi:hypothetical protein
MPDPTSAVENADRPTAEDRETTIRAWERLESLEREVKDLLDAIRFAPGAPVQGCGCPACQVLIPLLDTPTDQTARELVERARDMDWPPELLGRDDDKISDAWNELFREITERAGPELASNADSNRGERLIEGTLQGVRLGVAVLTRRLLRRYEAASLRAKSDRAS